MPKLNPPVTDAQEVWSFRKNENQKGSAYNLVIYSHIWDENQELEFNPDFWFATEKDCFDFLKKASSEEIQKMIN